MMDGQDLSFAAYAAIASGIFWLLYLGLVLVEYTGKVPYTNVFKTLGLSAGVLQALPILIPAAVLYEAFDDGASALNLAGFVAVCASAILISMSTLKYLKAGTRFEDVSDLLQAGYGLLSIWIMAVSLISRETSYLPAYVSILGIAASIGMGITSVLALIYGPLSPGIDTEGVPPIAYKISYLMGGIGFLGYPVWAIILGLALLKI
jgi:hypothetical protein